MKESTDVLARLGRGVRDLRKAHELSQEEFAAECGLDRTYIRGIERGRRNVSLRNLDLIARTLRLSLSELFREL